MTTIRLRVFLGLMGFVALAALLLSEASATTTTQCWNEWAFSSASDRCSHTKISIENGKCRISSRCAKRYQGFENTQITVPLNRAYYLNNCNGFLRDGSC